MPILDDRLIQAWGGSWIRTCFCNLPTPSHVPWGKNLTLWPYESPVGQLWPLETTGTRAKILHGHFCFSEIYYNQGHMYMCVHVCICMYMSLYMNTRAYPCVHIHVCTHIHTYGRLFQNVLAVSLWLELRTWLDIILLFFALSSPQLYSLRIWDGKVLLPYSPARFLIPPNLLFSLIELQWSRGKWGWWLEWW